MQLAIFCGALIASAAEQAAETAEIAIADDSSAVDATEKTAAVGGALQKCWQAAADFFTQVFTQDMPFGEVCYGSLLLWVGLLTLAFISGAYAVTVARRKNRNAMLFFLGGFVVPVVGPAVLYYAVKPAEESQADDSAHSEEIVAEDVPKGWNRPYFKHISLKSDGTPGGPWKITYNGATVDMLEIVETQAEFFKARVKNRAGEVITARIPYAKVENLEEA